MWGIETTAWLQWGANMNSVMERNIGQSLGVGAVFDAASYATTSRLDNLNRLEHTVYKLTPPAWPTDVFGAIDETKAGRGRELYDRQCANCHEKPFAVTPSGLVVYQLFTLKESGTSPLVATNFDDTVVVGGKTMRFATAAFAALESLKQQYYKANNVSEQTQAEWEGRTRRPPPQWKPSMRSTLAEADKFPDTKGGRVYPAKPLAGDLGDGAVPEQRVGRQHVGPAHAAGQPAEAVHARIAGVRRSEARIRDDRGCEVAGSSLGIRRIADRQRQYWPRLRHQSVRR